jgi:phosphoadenosine phosphosulfate reductase
MRDDLDALAARLNAAPPDTPAARLRALRAALPGRMVLTTGFGLEGQLITHFVARSGLDIELVTLDTGRLFPETLELWAETERRYGLRIRGIAPDGAELERLIARQGPEGFRASVPAREACCGVRKVAPLARALEGAAGWITGLRRSQSPARAQVRFAEVDTGRGLLKFAPLFDWTQAAVAEHVRALEIPYNRLLDRGFASVGCAPCTRALRPGERERDGRWWWEASARECGLHRPPADAIAPAA